MKNDYFKEEDKDQKDAYYAAQRNLISKRKEGIARVIDIGMLLNKLGSYMERRGKVNAKNKYQIYEAKRRL